MVVNEDPAKEIGSHWVAIYAKNNEHVFYFDSYGDEPNKLIKNYLNKNFKKITRNVIRIQNVFSNSCGHFCIYFIYLMCLNLNFDSIIKLMSNVDNIDIIVRIFVELIK